MADGSYRAEVIIAGRACDDAVFAAMPMLSIYPILAQPHGEEAFCAAALLLATLLSFLSISLWLWVATAVLGWPVG